jgi:hypothetical protein
MPSGPHGVGAVGLSCLQEARELALTVIECQCIVLSTLKGASCQEKSGLTGFYRGRTNCRNSGIHVVIGALPLAVAQLERIQFGKLFIRPADL